MNEAISCYPCLCESNLAFELKGRIKTLLLALLCWCVSLLIFVFKIQLVGNLVGLSDDLHMPRHRMFHSA
jgi:hypothetical protein